MTMPAGKYYVGDLCYVMHDEWDEFCALTISGSELQEGEFNLKDGRRFAFYSTRWGDGEYADQYGRRYGVDAGLIGCIRVEDINEKERENLDGGHVVEFTREFYVTGGRKDPDWDGVISVGNVYIKTDDDGDYEDY